MSNYDPYEPPIAGGLTNNELIAKVLMLEGGMSELKIRIENITSLVKLINTKIIKNIQDDSTNDRLNEIEGKLFNHITNREKTQGHVNMPEYRIDETKKIIQEHQTDIDLITKTQEILAEKHLLFTADQMNLMIRLLRKERSFLEDNKHRYEISIGE